MNYDLFIKTYPINKEDFDRLYRDGKLVGVYADKKGQQIYLRNRQKEYIHRLIMNPPEGMVVDHINRNGLDNRRSNLRIVTIQENLRNQKRPNNKTGHTGVAVYPDGRFTAQIKHNYKKFHLGIFDTIDEALKARRAAEVRLWS